jgi:magnesium transporter
VITCRLYRDGKLVEDGFDPARISDLLPDPANLVWLDVADPSEDELALIEEEFAIHPLAMEDTRHQGQRPKIEGYEDYFFLVFHGFGFSDGELETSEMHAFVGSSFLVTVRFPPVYDLEPVLRWWKRHESLAREGGGFLLYALLDHVVDGYFNVVDRFEDRSEEIEDLVFLEDEKLNVQEDIFGLKKQAMEFRRLAAPLREVLNQLQGEPRIVTESLRPYYRDVADHLIRTAEFVDNVRELLTTALEAHLSQVSNRLNMVMKQLTSWASIILVPTLIAGIYGMNFRHMPELSWMWGYPFALGVMLLSAGGLYYAFKRRGWL